MADAQIKITAETSQAQRALGDLDKALGALGTEVGKATKTFAAISAAAGAMGYAVVSAIDSVSDLKDMSTALGVSAQNLKYLQQSAHLAGVGAEELNSALAKMNNNIGTALIQKTGPAAAALKNLGINMDALRTASPDKQFQMITSALAKIPDPAQRSAIAMDLLGKQGPRLIEAAGAMDAIRQRTEEMGLALSDLDIEAIDRAGDAMDQLKGIVTNGVQKAVAGLAPYIIALVAYIEAGIKSIKENADAWMMVAKAVGIVVAAVITFRTYMLMTAIINSIMAAAGAMLTLYRAIKTATTAMEVMNMVMGKNPIVAILKGIVALGTMAFATKVAGDAFKGLDADAQKALKEIQDGMAKAGTSTNQTTNEIKIQSETLLKAQAAARKAFEAKVSDYENEKKYQQDILNVGVKQAEINKAVNTEKDKLAAVGLKISAGEEASLRNVLKQSTALKEQNDIKLAIQSLDSEAVVLSVRLNEEREIANAIAQKELQFQRELTDLEKEKYSNAIMNVQMKREELAIAQALDDFTGRQRKTSEQVKSGLNLMDQLNPRIKMEKDYDRAVQDLIIAQSELRQSGLMSELEATKLFNDSKLQLDMNYQIQKMELDNALFENRTKLRDMEIQAEANKHAESLRQQKDLFGNLMFNQEQLKGIAGERASFEKKTELEKTQFALQQGATIFNALGAQNKKAFEAAKAFNIANAVMNTYAGATKALATYPWPFGLIAAAAAVAAGMAQVNAIRSQQYTGKALGGPMVGGKAYLVGEKGPEIFTPGQSGSMTPNNKISGSPTIVNFNITANDTTGFDELLTSRRQLITTIIADAQLEKGMR